jgi:hypothetical protein
MMSPMSVTESGLSTMFVALRSSFVQFISVFWFGCLCSAKVSERPTLVVLLKFDTRRPNKAAALGRLKAGRVRGLRDCPQCRARLSAIALICEHIPKSRHRARESKQSFQPERLGHGLGVPQSISMRTSFFSFTLFSRQPDPSVAYSVRLQA